MGRFLEVSRGKVFLSVTIFMLLSICFGSGQAWASEESSIAAYSIDVAENTIAEANHYMQIVIYVAAVCIFCACMVILMLAGKDSKKKRATHKEVTGQIRELYEENKS